MMTTYHEEKAMIGTYTSLQTAALAVREAELRWIREWEAMYDLPRSIPTRRERDAGAGGALRFVGTYSDLQGRAVQVRDARLAVLEAWEAMYGLPRAKPE